MIFATPPAVVGALQARFNKTQNPFFSTFWCQSFTSISAADP